MKYSVRIDENSGICWIHVTESFVRPDDSDMLKRLAADIFANNGCCRFLIDLTEAHVVGGTMSTFKVANPEGAIAETLKRIKSAFVRHVLSEEDRFFENVAVNRGFPVRAFETCEKAVEWLMQE